MLTKIHVFLITSKTKFKTKLIDTNKKQYFLKLENIFPQL